MGKFTPHVATLEIPVSNLKKSLDWYLAIFDVKVHYQDSMTAMLTFESKGVPTIYLVETGELNKLSFKNTKTENVHSIIDFFTPSLAEFHSWLKEQDVLVGTLNIDPNHGYGGFSFQDPDGNLLGATNVLHPGQ
ncbi:VOC family protein [Bacillus sp. PK3-056]|uniref:VOC family protein n=1 Tax=Niallia circulans TaxID=1397 RepID=UPI000F45E0C0|nr:VOC family protein [Niallia circulans]AYV74480.1 glyoxalase/bleomycin resistance/dioxygenase family protein [Niallia circulans]